MRSRLSEVSAALFVLAVLAPATALGTVTNAAATGCKVDSGAQSARTSSYRFVLRVGMPEQMYTPAQVTKMHPKHGEVMLRGRMNGMGGMSMGGSMRHLEVQICTRPSHTVITTANPTITVKDDSSMGMATKVPVTVMQGVGAGTADLHYGNNVAMKPGHRYTIKVTHKGQTATFHTQVPKASM